MDNLPPLHLKPNRAAARSTGSFGHPRPWAVPEQAVWKVLIAESDGEEAESLSVRIRRSGHEVRKVGTGREAIAAGGEVSLILLALTLPDIDGLEVCRTIRRNCDVPIIAISSRSTEPDMVSGLQAGADDYLAKPYGFHELMARMNAVMRRAQLRKAADPVISQGALRIDLNERAVSIDGRPVNVTRKEFDFLYILAANPEAVVPRSHLIQEVWGGSWSSRTMDTHVNSLRRKLGAPDWIITVRGIGFQLGRA